MTGLQCSGKLELPRDRWVTCDGGLGHDGKHSGTNGTDRYWWEAQFARARSLVRITNPALRSAGNTESGST